MLRALQECLKRANIYSNIEENVQLLKKMSANGIITNPSGEQCKRQHEDEVEEQSKKQCTEENNVEDSQKKSLKRHKHAMLLGYNGNNYYGMQFNKNYRTVESELLKAFAKVGIMKECDIDEPHTIRFQRAARTDRSVSAAGQVVSLLMASDLCKPEDINVHLPSDIRIFSFKRVTKGFDSKRNCDARTYSYILPTQVLSEEPLDNFSETDYRITTDVIQKVNDTLNTFVGTHNFHNFTSKRHFSDPGAKRYIMSFTCGEPFVRDKEFITLTVTGQSFILHQIRKMVGATIAVARGVATIEDIQKSFLSERIRMPFAPGEGLFLERPHFDKYNRRYGEDGFHESLTWEDVENEIAKFKQEKIIDVITEMELKNKTMVNWVIDNIFPGRGYFAPHSGEENQKSTEVGEDEDEDLEEQRRKL